MEYAATKRAWRLAENEAGTTTRTATGVPGVPARVQAGDKRVPTDDPGTLPGDDPADPHTATSSVLGNSRRYAAGTAASASAAVLGSSRRSTAGTASPRRAAAWATTALVDNRLVDDGRPATAGTMLVATKLCVRENLIKSTCYLIILVSLVLQLFCG